MAGGAPDHGTAGQWHDAFALDELPVGQVCAVQLERHQLAIARIGEEELYALDNRCPQDGKPLSDGHVVGSRLRCAHHGHSFELKDGKCLRGDDDALSFAVRVREGRVEVQVVESSRDAEIERHTKALKEALINGRLRQVAREMMRLTVAGADPARVALEVAAFDALHGEHGSGPVLGAVSDALRLTSHFMGTEALLPLLHAADLALDTSKYRAPRRVPPSQDPGREPEGMAGRLLTLLEADEPEAADGLMRGALWRKWGRDIIEPWFFALHAAHFFASGQGLVYTMKAFDLLEATGFEHARRILPGLVYALGNMRRDDELPDFHWFRQRYAQLEPRLNELWARQGQRALDEEERRNVTHAILDGSREESWHAVIGALASGGRVESIIDALSRAAAERFWRFDPAINADATLVEGWRDVGEPVAYVHALRGAARRFRKPGLLKMVLFGVRAVNRLKPLDQPADRWLALDAKGRVSFIDRERLLLDLADMVRARQPAEAQRAALAYMALGGSVDALRAQLSDVVLRDLYATPAMTAHAIKLVVAVCDEAKALSEADRGWPLRALIRMLASNVREHDVERALFNARQLIEQGLSPRSRLA